VDPGRRLVENRAVTSAPVDDGGHGGWVARDGAVVWHGFTQMAAYADSAPLVVERAEGRELIDVDGRRYLDAISSLWVNTLGHRVPELDAALVAQVQRVAHTTMLGNTNVVVTELAEALAAVVPVDGPHFLFAADGAVAVEQALKIAFQYWVNVGEAGHTRFLALGDAYHGDTVGSLSLGDGGVFSAVFDPLCFEVLRTPGYADPGWAQKAVAAVEAHAPELAAVVVEPLVQGASGMHCAQAADVEALGRACAAHGVLLVCDEVATGFGRTGTLFASEQCGLRPDLLCLGKGITGGYLPMSATVASDRVFGAFLGEDLGPRTFFHGHSYGGNALAAAVAHRHLGLIDEWDVLGNVAQRGAQLGALLAEKVAPHPAVRQVRRRGLMVGVELAPPAAGLRWGRRVCAAATRRGVLLRPLGDVVVVLPPLTVTAEEVYRIVDALEGALDDETAGDLAAQPGPGR
jgi:adenosylmethionine-8-amino-7-oxononanoate aminotransferase